jgi:hypothetical protein
MKILNILKKIYRSINQHLEYKKMIRKLKQEDPFIYK